MCHAPAHAVARYGSNCLCEFLDREIADVIANRLAMATARFAIYGPCFALVRAPITAAIAMIVIANCTRPKTRLVAQFPRCRAPSAASMRRRAEKNRERDAYRPPALAPASCAQKAFTSGLTVRTPPTARLPLLAKPAAAPSARALAGSVGQVACSDGGNQGDATVNKTPHSDHARSRDPPVKLRLQGQGRYSCPMPA